MDVVSSLRVNLQFDNELLTAHCIQLGWVEMPVTEQEKANEDEEDNEDE
jgi:hypothetical protein